MTLQLYLIQFALVKEIFIHTPLVFPYSSPVSVGWSDKRFLHSSVRGQCPDPGEIPIIFLSWTSVLICDNLIEGDDIRRNDQSSLGWVVCNFLVAKVRRTHLKRKLKIMFEIMKNYSFSLAKNIHEVSRLLWPRMTGRTTRFCTVTSAWKSKYFLSLLIKLLHHFRWKVPVWQTLKNIPLILSISHLIILQSYKNFPYLKLPPNQTCLVSPLAGLAAALHTQTSLELGGQTSLSVQTTAWAGAGGWWLTHNSCLWSESGVSGETDQGPASDHISP